MSMGELTPGLLVQAIRIFYRHAYPSGKIPENRRYFLGATEDQPLEELLASKWVEELPGREPGAAGGHAIRLGNDWYAHMKLTIRPYKGLPGFVFGVATHDAFRIPPDSAEFAEVEELRRRNEKLARKIELAWERENLPTHNGLLREYLARSRKEEA